VSSRTALLAAAFLSACASAPVSESDAHMNAIAESYVKLVLAVGQHDPDYVDAYYGPPEWKKEAEAERRPLAEIGKEAGSLLSRLRATPLPEETSARWRRAFLARHLEALEARVAALSGRKLSFDEESRALFDAIAPVNTEEHFRTVLDALENELPGSGPLVERLETFRKQFVIPADRLDAVFQTAIAEARRRSGRHIALPETESFTVEYVTGKSWSGYNWYQGDFRSLIQVNTDLPTFIDRALDLACHEGYPGHHVYNALLEKHLVRDRGWVEFSVYPLFSPMSLIAEGSANFGIEVAFLREERLEFEEKVLYPAAGLDPARAKRYAQIRELTEKLAYAGNEAARRYLNGQIDAKEAADFLERYALSARSRAQQRVRFFDQYRSYVINYNLGKDLVRRYIESRGGTPDRPEKRWEEFERLLSFPPLPSEM
jgi:hypothetical protein